jgi:hypothetical protein
VAEPLDDKTAFGIDLGVGARSACVNCGTVTV